MDTLTFYTMAAHHPQRLVIDWDGDLWHAGCLVEHIVEYGIGAELGSQVEQGPDAFPVRQSGDALRGAGRYECWKCYEMAVEPWTP